MATYTGTFSAIGTSSVIRLSPSNILNITLSSTDWTGNVVKLQKSIGGQGWLDVLSFNANVDQVFTNLEDTQYRLNCKEKGGDNITYSFAEVDNQTDSLSGKNTDDLSEGDTNQYFTQARTIASVITGYVKGAGTVSATDTILQAIQKLAGNQDPTTWQNFSVAPSFGNVTVTTNNSTGKYKIVNSNLLFWKIKMDYSGLDTADLSPVTIDYMPVTMVDRYGNAQINMRTSTAFTLASTDTYQANYNTVTDSIVFINSAGYMMKYSDGKIASSGIIDIAGWYEIAG